MIPSIEQSRSKTKPTKRPDFVPGLMMVRIREDVVAQVPSVRAASMAEIRSFRLPQPVADPLRELRRKRQIKEVIPVFGQTEKPSLLAKASISTAATLAFSVRHSENEDLRGINLLKVSENVDLVALEKDLNATPGIVYAHRVPARWLLAAKAKGASGDPSVNRQWGLRAIRWFQATLPPNVNQVLVAVLDTGVDTTHPELKKYFAGSKKSHYNYDGASPTDIIGHGTHVSGIIAADPANQIGIAGICPCDLRVWKIFGDQPSSDGNYYVDTVMYQRALNAARNEGAKVMNLSIGGGAPSQTERLLFTRLIQAGVTVVAAMGNEYDEGNPIEYPGAYPNVIAVGAINEANERASFSNTGKRIALCAPGVNILSTLPMKKSVARKETKYAAWDGTSMATPHVCAAAALVQAKNAQFLPADITKKLQDTAAKVPAMGSQKWTNEYGNGLLDLEAALK
jgi:subtilisin family serine protease